MSNDYQIRLAPSRKTWDVWIVRQVHPKTGRSTSRIVGKFDSYQAAQRECNRLNRVQG